jgi:thioredoxin-like negative regulator of GroEL
MFNVMIYKELLQTLADQATANYKDYLQSKITSLEDVGNDFSHEKTQQYKDAAENLEKKFSAALATVKNGQGLDENVPEEEIDNFLK